MTTLAPPTPLALHSEIRVELEPDKAWKDELRAKIEDSLSSMVEDAKNKYQTELSKGTASDALREAINREYEETMDGIRIIAQETYMDGLQRERQERRWAAGVDMYPGWNEALVREQQDIMDRISKGARRDTQSPSVAERSMAERPIVGRHIVELSSSQSSYLFSSHAQKGTVSRRLAKEPRESSLNRLEQGLITSQSLQLPPTLPAIPERQRQQEEKARRILERKERERRERERQEKADQKMEKSRKEKEETEERLKEQEHPRRMEKQLLEKEHAESRERAEKDRQARKFWDKQRQELERMEKERMEKQRQFENEILQRQRLDNERKKELENEKKETEETEETEEREEAERKGRGKKERREKKEREREERGGQGMERERQEKERQEMKNVRLDRDRRERNHLERLEAARVEEEREQKERWKREEEQLEREKAREIQLRRDRQREYVQGTQVHGAYDCRRIISFHSIDEVKDRPEFPLNRDLPQSTASDFSDTCDTDDLELLSPPSIPTRKQSNHERLLDPVIRSNNDLSRLLSSTDQLASRSPSMMEDDATTKPLSTEMGKSSGSVGVRPIIVDELIPERSDSEAKHLDKDTKYPEVEDWHPLTKSRETERREEHRENSASDGPRGVPRFPNARASRGVEDPSPLPLKDRYDSEQSYRGLGYHRSEETPSHPSSSRRAPLRLDISVPVKAEEAHKKGEEAKEKEDELLRRAREAKRKEEEARLKEKAGRKEEETKKKEEEVQRQTEEARKKEEEVKRREGAFRKEARRLREEAWKREQDIKYREEELKQKEEELRRREREVKAEKLQKEEESSRKEAERLQK
ncbi:hypothetical protein C0992_009092, partial [Termitomyces sp. T32_za158]